MPGKRIALGLGVPLTVAIAWATFGSPRAPYRFPEAGRLALETAIFGAAIWALADAGRPGWAIGFAIAALVNTGLMIAWRQ